MIAGVAGGIAVALDLPPLLVRLVLFVSCFTTFGLTALLYLAAAFSFSSKQHFETFGDAPKIFGVCYNLAKKMDVDLGWTRFAVLAASIFTGLFPIPFLYVLFHLFGESKVHNKA